MEYSLGSIGVFFKAHTAELVKGVEEVNHHLEHFKHGVEALGAFEAFEKISEKVLECVEAFSESEINFRKLSNVVSSPLDVSKFVELSEELSHVSTFSKDAAMSALSLLGKFNLNDEQMATMLPKLADFAAFMGTDLPSAAEHAGKAIANGSAGLRGLGLAFTTTEKQAFDMASQEDRVAILADKMGSKFHGMAEAVAGTGAGAMKQFHNAIEEAEIAIGKMLDTPVAAFFHGMTEVIDGVVYAINNMSDGMRTALMVVGGIIGGFTSMVTATLAVQGALAFFGGLPAILTAVAAAASTALSVLLGIVAPITVIAGTVIMLEGMVSRIRAGNFDMNEGVIAGIKNNFMAGLEDIKSGFKSVFVAPAAETAKVTETMKEFDNTLKGAAGKLKGGAIDFGGAEGMAASKGDPFGDLSNSIGIDFAKHVDEAGAKLEGSALEASQASDAQNASQLGSIMQGEVNSSDKQDFGAGMNQSAITARSAEMTASISGVDVAVAGLKSGGMQLAQKMGGAGSALAGVMTHMASGDVVGGMVGLGVEMLTRTKSFSKVMGFLEKILTQASQVLEPIVAAIVPFMDVISQITPVLTQLDVGIKLVGVVLKAVGEGLKAFVKVFGDMWNGVMDSLASFFAAIPAIGEDIANWLRGAKMQLEPPVEPVAAALEGVTAPAQQLGKTLETVNDSARNLPEGFKIAAARFAAIQRGEGDTEQRIKKTVTPYSLGIAASPRATAAAFRGEGAWMDVHTERAPTIHSAGRGGIGGIPTHHSSVQINTVHVTADKPENFVDQVRGAAQKETFLRTGKTMGPDTTRQYWGM